MREKLIELIEQVYFCSIEMLADHLLANGVTVQKWIPVSERLPELHTRVLCRGPKGGDFVAETRICAERILWDDRLRIGRRNVTHWMPLPEPPKED